MLQPNGRKSHLVVIERVFFFFTRNRRKISLPSGPACGTTALSFHVRLCSWGLWSPLASYCCTNVTGTLLPSGWILWITELELWKDTAVNTTLPIGKFYFWTSFTGNAGHCERACVPVKPTAKFSHLCAGFIYITFCRCFANTFISFFSFRHVCSLQHRADCPPRMGWCSAWKTRGFTTFTIDAMNPIGLLTSDDPY